MVISLILITYYNIGYKEYILRIYLSVLSIIRNSKWRKNNILDAIEYVQYDISK